MIRGKYIKTLNEELLGGARINFILFEIFRTSLNTMDPFDVIKDDDIRTAIKNANGLKSSLFVPEIAFENLVR
jgi:dynamin 1-like protein